MLQKVVVALLVFTVIGALGVGIYDAMQNTNDDVKADVLANPAQAETLPVDATDAASDVAAAPVDEFTTQTVSQTVDQPLDTADAQAVAQVADPLQGVSAQQVDATPVPVGQGGQGNGNSGQGQAANQTSVQTVQEPVQQVEATSMVGDAWSGIGVITGFDTSGMTLQRADGSEVYVELGPSHYWEGQAVTLAVGDQVTVIGFFNGEQYHSATVIKADGSRLELRTADGQPLWSGGGNASGTTDANGNTNGNANGNGNAAEPQVAAEDWVTVEGVVTALGAQQLTMQAQTGEFLNLELGSADFMAEQGVSFATGDPISVLGFWQDGMFRAGEITKTMTGERLMLLDPNGRPLWAGPGRAGQNAAGGNAGNPNGQGGQGQGGNSGQGGQGQSSTGGQGQGGNGGQGGQGQGGQGQGQNNQGVQVPADEWETVSGVVAQVEDLSVTLQVNGKTVVVVLGQVDFWAAQGISFPLGTSLTVDGFWLNGQFEAGIVTFDATGYELEIRDSFGRLLWNDETGGQGQGGNGGQGSNGSQGQGGNGGNGYQGGRNPDFQGGSGNQNG